MNTQTSSPKTGNTNGLIGTGILTAFAASLCCITPVLALIAGVSGMASAFSWLEPARPYLMGVTVLVLGFAWYQKLKPRTKEEIECACEEDEKPSFWQSKKFLGIVTVFAALMLAFPYYAKIFYPKSKAQVIVVESNNIEQANFEIAGMTCTACEEHVKHAVAQLPGVIDASADYKTGRATVKFDKTKTTVDEVVKAVNETGYKVKNYNITE
ncbi:MAG: hypothetical protein KatS3mg031_1271 [Chitinophagales bacterium]|nr:MAG: hypothetical protein KatS3mg031_1271 [Chitinophagales bacterium]